MTRIADDAGDDFCSSLLEAAKPANGPIPELMRMLAMKPSQWKK